MKFIIKHEISGRIRIHFTVARMTCREADILLFYLEKFSFVERAKVYERTADAVIYYTGDRAELLRTLCSYSPEKAAVPEKAELHSGRELNAAYQEKLINSVLLRVGTKLFYLIRCAHFSPLSKLGNTSGKESNLFPKVNWKSLYLMLQQSQYP